MWTTPAHTNIILDIVHCLEFDSHTTFQKKICFRNVVWKNSRRWKMSKISHVYTYTRSSEKFRFTEITLKSMRQRPCDGLIPRPRSPTNCLRWRNWSETNGCPVLQVGARGGWEVQRNRTIHTDPILVISNVKRESSTLQMRIQLQLGSYRPRRKSEV
jgi:hypothetical protein